MPRNTFDGAMFDLLQTPPVPIYVSADDTRPAFVVKCINPSAGADTVAVAVTTSDISFVYNGVADTELGTIDVSNASYNTLGEVVAFINTSTNWRAFIKAGLAADSVDGKLVTMSATAADTTTGLDVCWDTSTCLHTTVAVSAQKFVGDAVASDAQVCNQLFFIDDLTSTFGSGTSVLTIMSVDSAGAISATLWTETGGATTTAKDFDFRHSDLGIGCFGKKLLIRLTNSAAMASVTGKFYHRSVDVRDVVTVTSR